MVLILTASLNNKRKERKKAIGMGQTSAPFHAQICGKI
jgi:hypothetical protein